jgi:hypothetical protein
MKLLPIVLLPLCFSAKAAIIHVDLAGTLTDGSYQGQSITLALDFDTSMPTRALTADGNPAAYYEWATNGPNWMDASFTIGGTLFDASVSQDAVEGLFLKDQQLGAATDEWHAFYLGRQFTALTPFVDGYADALLMGVNLDALLTNSGDFIVGLGKEQEFSLSGDSIGTGRLSLGYSLVHEYDGYRFNHETAVGLSAVGGTFNITSAKATKVPEPTTLALLGLGLLGILRGSRNKARSRNDREVQCCRSTR